MLRPFAIAGVCMLGAGLVAGVATGVGYAPSPATAREVTLTSGESGLLTPWVDVFNTASENSTKLLNTFFEAPAIGWQQFIANMSGYLQDWFNDPTSINASMQQIQANLNAVTTGYGLQNADTATTNIVLAHTLDGIGSISPGHAELFSEIPGYIPAGEQAAAIPIVNFLGSPASGIIMGMLGPEISPWVALANSISAGDSLNETLANMVGGYFNGATLNLDSLLPTINGLGLFPKGMAMANLDIGFGGLLSPGSVGHNADPGVGGSIFNSVGINFTGVPAIQTLDAPSQPVGPLGAWEGWAQTIAALLGWHGSGSPLADVTLPTIPTDFFDGGSAGSMAADVSTVWQDLLAAL
ncbi:outer membrane porin GjpA [Mycobacterium sp. SVM_VP21]|nr:outer membrane porin GjpA [Mycobacterium sp. SVM_VP21]